MADLLPPGLLLPPPPPRWALPPPPPQPWRPPPSPTPTNNSPTSPGGVIAGVCIAVAVFLLVLTFICSLCQGYRNSRDNAAADAASAAAALAARPRMPTAQYWDNDELEARIRKDRDNGHPRRASPTAGLPSFTYNRSVKHNVAGSGDEEPTCSVCLGALQVGETVRLLPVCLHLFHVECIDPWLDAHSTCPICRSGTDPTMDIGLVPSV